MPRLMLLSLCVVLALAILAPARVNHLTRNACADHGGVLGVDDSTPGQRGIKCKDGIYLVMSGR